MLLGHQGASGRTDCMYLLDRQPRRRIIPRQGQMHDATRHFQLVDRRQLFLGPQQQIAQRRLRQGTAVIVDLQRADAGVRSMMPGSFVPDEPLHESMNAKAQLEIENRRAILNEQIVLAGVAVSHRDPALDPSSRCSTGEACDETLRNRMVSPGRNCPIFQRSADVMTAGHTKPPRLGPSGPRMTGISPV